MIICSITFRVLKNQSCLARTLGLTAKRKNLKFGASRSCSTAINTKNSSSKPATWQSLDKTFSAWHEARTFLLLPNFYYITKRKFETCKGGRVQRSAAIVLRFSILCAARSGFTSLMKTNSWFVSESCGKVAIKFPAFMDVSRLRALYENTFSNPYM